MAMSFDPGTMATQLANYYVQATQKQLDAQSAKMRSTSSALSKLQSALRAFDTAVSGLSSGSGLLQFSAGLSNPSIGSVSASPSAQAGTYIFFVEQLATVHQIGYREPPAIPVGMGGPLVVELADGSSFSVALELADYNGDDTISHSEIARAINTAEDNKNLVTASVVTDAAGQSTLVLSSGKSGLDGRITLDASGLPDTDLNTGDPNTAKQAFIDSPGITLVAAQNAVAWLGDKDSGIRMEQGSNSFDVITGVNITFTQAMNPGDSPVTLSIARDDQATGDKVQGLVTAYNTLKKTLDELTQVGNEGDATQTGLFATDAGVRALRARLNTIFRQDFDGMSLNALGVSADRNGQLSLDRTRLERTLTDNPEALDTVLGQVSLTTPSGVLGNLNQYLNQWLNATSGQIKRRQDVVANAQKSISARQERLDAQYDNAFTRHLQQFTQLQNLMAQMQENSGLFSALGNMNFRSST